MNMSFMLQTACYFDLRPKVFLDAWLQQVFFLIEVLFFHKPHWFSNRGGEWHRPDICIHVDSYFKYFCLLNLSILSVYQNAKVLKETSSTLVCIFMASQKPFGQSEVKNHLAHHITYWQYVESTACRPPVEHIPDMENFHVNYMIKPWWLTWVHHHF
jgi:hypothetical protein